MSTRDDNQSAHDWTPPEAPIEAGELPSLPKCHSLYGVHLDSLHTLYTADQMRTYGQLCRATKPESVTGAEE